MVQTVNRHDEEYTSHSFLGGMKGLQFLETDAVRRMSELINYV